MSCILSFIFSDFASKSAKNWCWSCLTASAWAEISCKAASLAAVCNFSISSFMVSTFAIVSSNLIKRISVWVLKSFSFLSVNFAKEFIFSWKLVAIELNCERRVASVWLKSEEIESERSDTEFSVSRISSAIPSILRAILLSASEKFVCSSFR